MASRPELQAPGQEHDIYLVLHHFLHPRPWQVPQHPDCLEQLADELLVSSIVLRLPLIRSLEPVNSPQPNEEIFSGSASVWPGDEGVIAQLLGRGVCMLPPRRHRIALEFGDQQLEFILVVVDGSCFVSDLSACTKERRLLKIFGVDRNLVLGDQSVSVADSSVRWGVRERVTRHLHRGTSSME